MSFLWISQVSFSHLPSVQVTRRNQIQVDRSMVNYVSSKSPKTKKNNLDQPYKDSDHESPSRIGKMYSGGISHLKRTLSEIKVPCKSRLPISFLTFCSLSIPKGENQDVNTVKELIRCTSTGVRQSFCNR